VSHEAYDSLKGMHKTRLDPDLSGGYIASPYAPEAGPGSMGLVATTSWLHVGGHWSVAGLRERSGRRKTPMWPNCGS